jgi:MFS family permease
MQVEALRAFRSHNYRLYFTGQSISLIGTWMQRTAVYWVVYIQTQSSLMLGVTVFATQFPSFLLSLVGGVVSDRYNRFKVLIVTQVASMVQATILTLLVLFAHYAIWEILTLSIVLGIINAFDVPARQALVYDMVDNKDDLSNAIALNSSMVNLARLVGPAFAGIVLEKLGAGICFLLNAASFAAVLLSLLLMKLPKYISLERKKKGISELKEGFDYLRRTPSIGYVILLLACISLIALPFNTLMPVYAKIIFNGNASIYGYINSCIGLGAICGTIFLASLKKDANLRRILFINTIIFGGGLILFSHISFFPLAMFFAVITGFGMMSQTTICNTIIQTNVEPDMRGRVISYFAMAFFGMQPIGGLLVGTIANYIGAPNTIMAEGIAAIIIILFFYFLLIKQYSKPVNQ